MTLTLTPLTLKEARTFVDRHHRHHRAPQGGLFAIGLSSNDHIIGCAIIGRPVARAHQNGYTAEVTRLCVLTGHKNACSKLYAAAWRAARALGYRRLITYTLTSETGASLKGAGWKTLGLTEDGRSWNRPSRPRVDTHPLEQKTIWEAQTTRHAELYHAWNDITQD